MLGGEFRKAELVVVMGWDGKGSNNELERVCFWMCFPRRSFLLNALMKGEMETDFFHRRRNQNIFFVISRYNR